MSVGSFVLMLHSHLPFYRKAGMWPFGEESFYECMVETYVPLLNMVSELWDEGIPAKITLGITPILAEQMADEHLKQGFEKYVQGRLVAAKADEERFGPRGEQPDADRFQLARYYTAWFQRTINDFQGKWNRDVLAGFRKFQDLNAIEITTSAATHCFSPLLSSDDSLNFQFKVGVESYKRHFGREPKGAWLPECAYRPGTKERAGIEKFLWKNGIKYFFVESHQITGGQTVEMRRVFGAYGTIEYIPAANRKPTGHDTFEAFWLKDYPVAVMGRQEQAGFQVWSADAGYPGDGNYREFHKKDDKSGLHYWKLTSKDTDLGFKGVYNPEAAAERVHDNSDHYVGLLQQMLTDQVKKTGETGLVMASFDTELFGHWWFEGIAWIKEVIKKLRTYTAVEMQTASEYLDAHPPTKAIELPESSWGAGGHWQVWYNDGTAWMWPIIHHSETTMTQLEGDYRGKSGLVDRALNQALRELLLLQSSDWPFLITTGQAWQYAKDRFNGHLERFNALVDMVRSSNIDEARLTQFEDIDNCFPKLDHNWFVAGEREPEPVI